MYINFKKIFKYNEERSKIVIWGIPFINSIDSIIFINLIINYNYLMYKLFMSNLKN